MAVDVGDFVVRRADGYFAYHLATVVDDEAQSISHIVRGEDLALSTPRQVFVQQQLGFRTPTYAHLPLVRDAVGRKLSKSDQAPPLDIHRPSKVLVDALQFLRQSPPKWLAQESLDDCWQWALQHWDEQKLIRPPENSPMGVQNSFQRVDLVLSAHSDVGVSL